MNNRIKSAELYLGNLLTKIENEKNKILKNSSDLKSDKYYNQIAKLLNRRISDNIYDI